MKEQLKLAEVKDCGRIQSFLTKAGISSEGVAESIHHFVIMEDENDELLATVGFEKMESMGYYVLLLFHLPSCDQIFYCYSKALYS